MAGIGSADENGAVFRIRTNDAGPPAVVIRRVSELVFQFPTVLISQLDKHFLKLLQNSSMRMENPTVLLVMARRAARSWPINSTIRPQSLLLFQVL